MKKAFTICSNNYLAQAKTLADSFSCFNPDYDFTICLVDTFSEEIDYSFFKPYEIICIENLQIEQLAAMIEKYDITELNTAVKPFIFHFLFKTSPDTDSIIYLDPDILIYQPFTYLETCLNAYDILLTPHLFSPIEDDLSPSEPDILNAGLYNLGFIAVRRSAESFRFIDWWQNRLKDRCIIDFANGLFVDQLWINFVPLYFKNTLIIEKPGYNVAYWNLHEREVSICENSYCINKEFKLVFFHFSGYQMTNPKNISKYQNRFTFFARPDIVPLFKEYHSLVTKNKYAEFINIPCHYIGLKRQKPAKNKRTVRSLMKKVYKHFR